MVLGLAHTISSSRERYLGREWLWWFLWLLGCVSIFTGRAAILTIAVVALTLMLMRPISRWGKLVFLVLLFGATFTATNFEVNLGRTRSVSVESLALAVQSIFGASGESAYDGTRGWRLNWWQDILNYTVFGEYFWTGKGYGVNLADSDGYQVYSDQSLRSPHNGHLTILARGGVPGLLAWLVLQSGFAVALIRAYLRSRRAGAQEWAMVTLWVLAYWLAFMVNGAFDVFLEGPQGGIWFWSVFGFGIAVLEMQRTGQRLQPDVARG
jgi:O-antigen ligase